MPGVWRSMDDAPHDGRVIEAIVPGTYHPVKIMWITGLVNAHDEDCGGWATAPQELVTPPGWDDGVCWELNADREPSPPPVAWREIGYGG